MQELVDYLESISSCVRIDLSNRSWHTDANIPSRAGWYYISTDTPLDLLTQQHLPEKEYLLKRKKETAKVRNYDIAARATRFRKEHEAYWNCSEVYSGMASNLLSRAREHTFGDPGTGGLVLSRYPALGQYEWLFCFVTFERFKLGSADPEMFLRLGEQVWRARNGWPLLCAE